MVLSRILRYRFGGDNFGVIKERFCGKYPVRKSIQTEFAHTGGEQGLQFQLDGLAYLEK